MRALSSYHSGHYLIYLIRSSKGIPVDPDIGAAFCQDWEWRVVTAVFFLGHA